MTKEQRLELRFALLQDLFHIYIDEMIDDHASQLKLYNDKNVVCQEQIADLKEYIKQVEQNAMSPDLGMINKYNKLFSDWMEAKHALHDMQDRVRQKYLALREEFRTVQQRNKDLEWSYKRWGII